MLDNYSETGSIEFSSPVLTRTNSYHFTQDSIASTSYNNSSNNNNNNNNNNTITSMDNSDCSNNRAPKRKSPIERRFKLRVCVISKIALENRASYKNRIQDNSTHANSDYNPRYNVNRRNTLAGSSVPNTDSDQSWYTQLFNNTSSNIEVLKRFIYITTTEKEIGELKHELKTMYHKLYPNESDLNVLTILDSQFCELQNEYRVKEVFDESNILYTVVDVTGSTLKVNNKGGLSKTNEKVITSTDVNSANKKMKLSNEDDKSVKASRRKSKSMVENQDNVPVKNALSKPEQPPTQTANESMTKKKKKKAANARKEQERQKAEKEQRAESEKVKSQVHDKQLSQSPNVNNLTSSVAKPDVVDQDKATSNKDKVAASSMPKNKSSNKLDNKQNPTNQKETEMAVDTSSKVSNDRSNKIDKLDDVTDNSAKISIDKIYPSNEKVDLLISNYMNKKQLQGPLASPIKGSPNSEQLQNQGQPTQNVQDNIKLENNRKLVPKSKSKSNTKENANANVTDVPAAVAKPIQTQKLTSPAKKQLHPVPTTLISTPKSSSHAPSSSPLSSSPSLPLSQLHLQQQQQPPSPIVLPSPSPSPSKSPSLSPSSSSSSDSSSESDIQSSAENPNKANISKKNSSNITNQKSKPHESTALSTLISDSDSKNRTNIVQTQKDMTSTNPSAGTKTDAKTNVQVSSETIIDELTINAQLVKTPPLKPIKDQTSANSQQPNGRFINSIKRAIKKNSLNLSLPNVTPLTELAKTKPFDELRKRANEMVTSRVVSNSTTPFGSATNTNRNSSSSDYSSSSDSSSSDSSSDDDDDDDDDTSNKTKSKNKNSSKDAGQQKIGSKIPLNTKNSNNPFINPSSSSIGISKHNPRNRKSSLLYL